MTLNKPTILRLIFSLTLVFSVFTSIYALDYTVLAPLPGTTLEDTCPASGCTTTLEKYLPGVFNFAIGIAAVMAFAVITYGGILYMTSDAIGGKSQGREHINNAITGLLLVLGAYIILYTINPDILNFSLTLKPIEGVVSTDTPATGALPMTPSEIAAHNTALRSLNPTSTGPQITPYRGACLNGQTVGCVNLNGLKQSAITGLQSLRNECNCSISITGGTEGGHTTGSCHNSGTCVDMYGSRAINDKITGNAISPRACQTYSFRGGSYLYEPVESTCGGEVASSGEHWHVVFN